MRLGLQEHEVAIVTFGNVGVDRAPIELVWAINQLRSWKINARLIFVGEANAHVAAMIIDAARKADVEADVLFVPDSRHEATYRDWLVGADIGVQLRTYGLGGLSGALLDCIAAGLPSVTNESLADASEAPDYIYRIPDSLSAVRLAEAIAEIVDAGKHLRRPPVSRAEMLKSRNFDNYTRPDAERTRFVMIALDITEFVANPVMAGIQRVVRELVTHWPKDIPLLLLQFSKVAGLKPVSESQIAKLFGDSVADSLFTNPANFGSARVFVPEVFYDEQRCDFYYARLQDDARFAGLIVYDFIPWLHPQLIGVTHSASLMPYLRLVQSTKRLAFISESTKTDYYSRIMRGATPQTGRCFPWDVMVYV